MGIKNYEAGKTRQIVVCNQLLTNILFRMSNRVYFYT